MKYLKYLLFFSFSIFVFHSCGNEEWETALYAQKIEGTSKILYKYDAWGGKDSHVFGYVILDSTETFEVNKVDNLPISYLEEIPNKNYIIGVKFEEPNNDKTKIFKPLRNSTIKELEIEIKTKIYQNNGFLTRSGGLREYVFESFKETRDSLYFYNLDDVKSMEPEHLNVLKLKKGNVVIGQNSSNEITQIDINDLKISKKDNEIISNVSYFLKPKNKLKSEMFTEYGIFKEKN